MALDFTGNNGAGQVAVKDTTTPANNKYNDPADSFLTQSGTSPKLVLWSDGLYRWTGHNAVLQSEAFDNASWTKLNGTVTANAAVSPDGTTTADKLVEGSGSNAWWFYQAPAQITGARYTYSVYAKAAGRNWIAIDTAGTSDRRTFFDLANGVVGTTDAAHTSTITAVGNGWYRCTVSDIAQGSSATNFVLNIASADNVHVYVGDGASGVYVWGAQHNRGPTALTYHVTTAAAWYGVPIEYDPTTAKFYALVEPQATNLALYASDFTNAAWVKSNMTTALTATGPDGVANSASTLTATAGNATALQAITSGSASRVTSMFVKRRTGSGVVNLTQDNGGTWTAVTVTAGWTNVPLAAVTSANPTVGIRIVTSGDAVDVAWFQHELTAVTSPIWTGSATVTRAADSVGAALASVPYSTAAGSWVADVTTYVAPVNSRIVDSGAGFSELFMGGATSVGIYDGTALTNTVASYVNAPTKVASAWNASGRAVTAQGLAPATDAHVELAATALNLGIAAGGGAAMLGRIRSLVYVPRRMTNVELQTRTAP